MMVFCEVISEIFITFIQIEIDVLLITVVLELKETHIDYFRSF